MSRKEKFSRSSRGRGKHQVTDARNFYDNESEIRVSDLPSRRKTHHSNKIKVVKIYYNILVVLFVALVIFLFWFGKKYSTTP